MSASAAGAGNVDHPLTLASAVLAGAVAVLVFNIEPVYLGVLHDQLGLTSTQMGLLAGVEIGGIGFASVAAVFWIRRVDWRLAMFFSVAVVMVGNVAAIYASEPMTLASIRGLVGFFGEGTMFAVANALFGDTKMPSRAFALSIFGQVGLGMLGLLIFPYAAAQWGTTGVFLGMAAPALLLLLALPGFPRTGTQRATASVDGSAEGSADVFLGLLVMCLWFLGLSSLWAFMERIGVGLGLTTDSIGTLLAVGLGLGAMASVVVSVVGDRFGSRWQPFFAAGAHLGLSLLLLIWPVAGVYVFVVLVFTLIWNIGLPYLLGNIARADRRGKYLVLIIAAQALGNTLGPVVGGYVVQGSDYLAVAYQCVVFCLLALGVCTLFSARMRRRDLAESA